MGRVPLAEEGEVLLSREVVDRAVRLGKRHVGAELTAALGWPQLGLGLPGVWAFLFAKVACEFVTPSGVHLDGPAARREVEAVAPQGDDAPQRADGDDGVRLADGAEEALPVEVVLALPSGGEGSALPADGLLVAMMHETQT